MKFFITNILFGVIGSTQENIIVISFQKFPLIVIKLHCISTCGYFPET